MKRISISFLFFLTVLYQGLIGQTNYYLSSSTGADSNAGSIQQPFKTLSKINKIVLGPGDTVFFRKGERFDGRLKVNGSGTERSPIVITSYGNGAKPIITGLVDKNVGDYMAAILVENNEHIVFDDLDVQNNRRYAPITVGQNPSRAARDSAKSYGIHILNSESGTMHNFIFRNLTIRDVYSVKTVKASNQKAFNAFTPAGIKVEATRNTKNKVGTINGILVENCLFVNLQRLGIHLKHNSGLSSGANDSINRIMNIVVRNNEFQHTGGTCVLPIRTYNCLIENNMFYYPGSRIDSRMPGRGSSVWTWYCINTVIQNNTCLHIRGIWDSHGIHIDHTNQNTFIQYNYMEDCEGGFVEILGGNNNAVYRYNVSVNDGWRNDPNWRNGNHTIWVTEKAHGINTDSVFVYNNTVFMNREFSTAIDAVAKNIYIYNNIFHANKGDVGKKQTVLNGKESLFVSNNLFHGDYSAKFTNLDKNSVMSNPMFSHEGISSPTGYQLRAGSPAINAGVAHREPVFPLAGIGIFINIPSYPVVDFFGNTLSTHPDSVNIGACDTKKGEIINQTKAAVTGVIQYLSEVSIKKGRQKQLFAGVIPANADNQTLIWKSLNPSIATVSNGLIKGLSGGITKIVVESEDGKFNDVMTVRVLDLQ